MPYQSFDDAPGDSKSDLKLRALALPASLEGKSVLDLGCNEGFFSFEAKRRNAAHVLGLDHDPRAVIAARKRAAELRLDVDFQVGKMTELPAKQFDFILLLSALHYIDEPAELLSQIRSILKPNGKLVLELGVVPNSHGRVLGRSLRSIDERYFATNDLLRKVWLKGYAVREIGLSIPQAGDPIPRYVFHCTPALKTNVLLIIGKGGIGKSTLASQLGDAPAISTDELFSPIRTTYPRIEAPQKLYDQVFHETKSIWATWDRIKQEPGVRHYFASVIASAIRHCAGSGLVIVEGFVLEFLVDEIKQLLGDSYQCWESKLR